MTACRRANGGEKERREGVETIAPIRVYPTGILPELRDFLSMNVHLIDASPEAIAERLDLDPWLVEIALESLVVDGEVLG